MNKSWTFHTTSRHYAYYARHFPPSLYAGLVSLFRCNASARVSIRKELSNSTTSLGWPIFSAQQDDCRSDVLSHSSKIFLYLFLGKLTAR